MHLYTKRSRQQTIDIATQSRFACRQIFDKRQYLRPPNQLSYDGTPDLNRLVLLTLTPLFKIESVAAASLKDKTQDTGNKVFIICEFYFLTFFQK
jgi:hypothetical protein